MKTNSIIFILLSFVSILSLAYEGRTKIDDKNRQWLFNSTKMSPTDAKTFCQSRGYQAVSVAEGLAIVQSQQAKKTNKLLEITNSQSLTFWTNQRGFSIDAIDVGGFGVLAIPYPGYFHKVVIVYKYPHMNKPIAYDNTNQPLLSGTKHYPLCIK